MKEHKTNIRCYLCGNDEQFHKEGVARDAREIEVLKCEVCGLIFLESASHINEGFYENSGMHAGEVSLDHWIRETAWDDDRRFSYLQRSMENKSVLDVGCGNGGFLTRARSVASRCDGVEPETHLHEYFRQKQFRVYSAIDEVNDRYDIITLFHVLEHMPDPRKSLIALGEKLHPHGELIIEVPNVNDALLSLYQSSDFTKFAYWSCHLFVFNEHTLTTLIRQTGYKVKYIKQIQRYPLSNHLHWLSRGKPGGHKEWAFLDSAELHAAYEKQLAALGLCDTLIASLRRANKEE
jgi:2-polyprenyl-3-methyl-5-hydroxy-6-metoxy-1,4-benzoquinol methylase